MEGAVLEALDVGCGMPAAHEAADDAEEHADGAAGSGREPDATLNRARDGAQCATSRVGMDYVRRPARGVTPRAGLVTSAWPGIFAIALWIEGLAQIEKTIRN